MNKVYEICTYWYDEWYRLGFYTEDKLEAIKADITKTYYWLISEDARNWGLMDDITINNAVGIPQAYDICYFLDEALTKVADSYKGMSPVADPCDSVNPYVKDEIIAKILEDSIHEYPLNTIVK